MFTVKKKSNDEVWEMYQDGKFFGFIMKTAQKQRGNYFIGIDGKLGYFDSLEDIEVIFKTNIPR